MSLDKERLLKELENSIKIAKKLIKKGFMIDIQRGIIIGSENIKAMILSGDLDLKKDGN